MKAITIEGQWIDLKQELIDNLKMRLKGQLLIAGDNGYDDSRTVWNSMLNRYPSIIVRCLGTADVIASIQFVREHGLLLCIKGGGHNIAGLATADGAFMMDMSLMRGVWVDTQQKIAHAQAGCLLGDVDRETQVHGLASVLGFVSATGVSGLTLGGGFGYLTKRYGWTADNVAGMDMVTADGKVVRASNTENEDLFWGLRGGGGNFGIVTGIDFNLFPVGPEIIGGLVAWPGSEAQEVFELYRTLAGQAPPELTLVLLMRPAPPAPWLPPDIHGKPIVGILACYAGTHGREEKIINTIKSFKNPVGDTLIPRTYIQMQSLLDATQPKGRRYYWKSEYLTHLDEALGEKAIMHAGKISSPHSAVILFQIEGALNRMEPDFSAAGNRNAHFVLNIASAWEKEDDDKQNIGWARDAWNDMKVFSAGGNYINFQTYDEGSERIESAFGRGFHRLTNLKARWDPENFFRTNRNIRPIHG